MQIRSQSPILQHINDNAEIWSEMWREQVNQNVIPYYMFIPRDTGARDYFAVPLVKAWEIFREAYTSVSGICRSVRGPSMSCTPGKIQILGVSEINQEKSWPCVFARKRTRLGRSSILCEVRSKSSVDRRSETCIFRIIFLWEWDGRDVLMKMPN